MKSLTQLTTWQALTEHYHNIASVAMRDWFAQDPQRFMRFSLSAAGLLLDYSKNRINTETISLLCELANRTNLPEKIQQLFTGHPVNSSEKQAALHTALRQPHDEPIYIHGDAIITEIRTSQKKMHAMVTAILQRQWLGFNGQPITDVVNIGVGGSDLGSLMATEALKHYAIKSVRCHFISNIDGTHIIETLKNLNPATTLFIVSSKNFSTQETLCNAKTAKQWILQAAIKPEAIKKHFLAVTAKPKRAIDFGIDPENILTIWDWVGGRYSLWSAVGLPIALAIGMENFQQLLAGAYAMDQHFRTAPLAKNMPVILALLSIWYVNFFHAQSQAIIPYDQNLQWLPTYLQQVHMESHGKQTRLDGSFVNYSTGPVIWGGIGSNGQHAFHQLLHQGTPFIPIDFIIAGKPHHHLHDHHALLFANCLSQSQALMLGKNRETVIAELMAEGLPENEAKQLAQHKMIPGNRPSNIIILPQLTPFSLGALIALYEHKIFTQSVIWDINCFDQWSVELGKQLATNIFHDLQNEKISTEHDASTLGLIEYYKNTEDLMVFEEREVE